MLTHHATFILLAERVPDAHHDALPTRPCWLLRLAHAARAATLQFRSELRLPSVSSTDVDPAPARSS